MTWITLALAAGVPLELVQRVTGHRTVEVVLKHYFRPGREDFKQRILSAMPRLLTGQADAGTIEVEAEEVPEYIQSGSPSEELSEALTILKSVTGKANREHVSRAAELIQKAKKWYDGHVIREPEVVRATGCQDFLWPLLYMQCSTRFVGSSASHR